MFSKKKHSQIAWVLSELLRGRKLTALICVEEMQIYRLSGIIWVLRKGLYDGKKYPINSVCAPGHGFATYSL